MKGAQNRRSLPNVEPEVLVDADLDTLATALYVRTDDLLKDNPHRIPWRPKVGITPLISDAEMVTLSVMQALLGYTSDARWLRFAGEHLRHLCVGDQRGDTHLGAPRNPMRVVLEQVIGTDIQCGCKGVQVGVHENLRFDVG